MATQKKKRRAAAKRGSRNASEKGFRTKPKLAAALLVASGLIAIVVSVFIGISSFHNIPYLAVVNFGVGVVIAIAIIASGMNTYTKDKKISEKWAVIALILYIIEIPALWGFGIGFIIALIGTIVALRHR